MDKTSTFFVLFFAGLAVLFYYCMDATARQTEHEEKISFCVNETGSNVCGARGYLFDYLDLKGARVHCYEKDALEEHVLVVDRWFGDAVNACTAETTVYEGEVVR